MNKFIKLCVCTWCNCTASDKNVWLLWCLNHLDCSFNIFCLNAICNTFNLLWLFTLIFCLICSNILCDINKHRTRTSFLCNLECTTNCISQFIDILYDEIMLCDRHCNTSDIDLLEGISSQKWNSNVTCNCNNRNRIHVSCCNSRYQIGSTWARCGHADTYLSGCPCIAVCCMRRALLMGG